MEKIITLSHRESEHWSNDVYTLMDEITPLIYDFYKKYNIEITSISYKGSMQNSADIVPTIPDQKEIYPVFYITISNLGSGAFSPSERMFTGTVIIKNRDPEIESMLYKTYDLSIIKSVDVENGTAIEKVTEIIKQVDAFIIKYYDYYNATNFFMF